MVDHLGSEAALKVEHERRPRYATQRVANRGALMKMPMNDVRPPTSHRERAGPAQQHVEV
jgi:hypothetical protein